MIVTETATPIMETTAFAETATTAAATAAETTTPPPTTTTAITAMMATRLVLQHQQL